MLGCPESFEKAGERWEPIDADERLEQHGVLSVA
jgi:hypothetical protein